MMLLGLLVSSAIHASPVTTDDSCGIIECGDDGDGVYVGLTREEVTNLANVWPPGSSSTNPSTWFEYVGVVNCPGNSPEHPWREICGEAVAACEHLPDDGPYVLLFRRTVSAGGEVGTWSAFAGTCFRSAVPPRSGEAAPVLTEEMIIEAFHRTDFALPQAVLQPPDSRTLVNLPVYFELGWPEAGYSPGEIDTVDLAGFQVRIRPTLVGATYLTGDGTSIGPTTSLGGPHPDGDITHTYTATGSLTPSIVVEYGGEVSVDGDPWRTIPATATVEGPSVPLDVLASRNRLYDN